MIALLIAVTLHVPLRQSVTVAGEGATAAYAVDDAVAETSVRGGKVTVTARNLGSTEVTAVFGSELRSWRVIVDPLVAERPAVEPGAERQGTAMEASYDSATERLVTGLDVLRRDQDGGYRIHLLDVTPLGTRPTGDAATSFPSASLAIDRGARELTLLDQLVEQSPLTIDGTSLRGVHYRGDGLALHAGYTSPVLYQGVLLASNPESAVGGSYSIAKGRSTFTPNVYYFNAAANGGTRGAMGSMLYGFSTADDRMRLRAEAGYGGEPGGALDLAYEGEGTRFWISARQQPRGFASLGLGRPHGSFVETSFRQELAKKLTLDLNGTAARPDMLDILERNASASADLRYLPWQHWWVSAGTRVAAFQTGSASVRSLQLPVGLGYEGESVGVSALYRRQYNSASSRGGNGGRFSLRGSWWSLRLTAFADAQQDAATLDLLFREDPDLARALAELGLSVQTPEDFEALLRDNPALAALGVVQGVSIDLHPWRVQGGGELAWLAKNTEVRLRATLDRGRTVSRLEQTSLVSFTLAQRIGRSIQAMAGISAWSREAIGLSGHDFAFTAGLRVELDRVPHLPIFQPDAITGQVRADGAPLAAARVRLDGTRLATTGADGRFHFDGVGAGLHRVEALLPEGAGAYFTTPSSAHVEAGTETHFGLAWAPARVSGSVRDDAGAGIAGVTVRLVRGSAELATVSDSEGNYAIQSEEGDGVVSIDPASLKEGYDPASTTPALVHLSRDAAVHADLAVSANRSVSGTIHALPRFAVPVWVRGNNRKALADRDGRYVLRGLTPGTWLIQAEIDGRVVERRLEVPQGPFLLRGFDFELGTDPKAGKTAAAR